MPELASLPDSLRGHVEQLALHEAGHAVACVALGFTLRSIRFSDDGVGTTDCGGCDVPPGEQESQRSRMAAIVAMAGREARRRKYPEADAAWARYEETDLCNALWHLGLPLDQTLDSAKAETVLEPVTSAARELLRDRDNWRAVEKVAATLIRRGSLPSSDDGVPFRFPSDVDGEEVTSVVLAVGVSPIRLDRTSR